MLDISIRAIKILKKVDYIATEDYFHTKKILNHYKINNKLIMLHKFNENKKNSEYIKKLQNGKNIAIVSKAGTPLINDPGYILVSSAIKKKIRTVAIPGACSAITALVASGIETKKFCYEGFLSKKKEKRKKEIKKLKKEERTIILYESPKRIQKTLLDIIEIMGKDRIVSIAKELTKIWESIITSKVKKIYEYIIKNKKWEKGEIVLIISGAKKEKKKMKKKMKKILNYLLLHTSKKTTIQFFHKIYGIKKNIMYNMLHKKNNEVNKTVAISKKIEESPGSTGYGAR